MNRSRLLVAAIAVVVAGAAFAAPPAPSAAPQRHHAMKLDTNNDGAIDRAEAGKHARLLAKFDTLDKNRDGKLDASERPARQGKRGHRGGAMGRRGMARMGQILKLDSNSDGRISRAEAAAKPKLAARFDQSDANRDGYLVRSELRASAGKERAARMAQHRARFETKFAAADSNHDGKLSRFEVDGAMPQLAKAFAFHDEDRDGFLTRADLQPAPRR